MEESASGKVNKKKLFYVLTAVWCAIIIAIFGLKVMDDYQKWSSAYESETFSEIDNQRRNDYSACEKNNPLSRRTDSYKSCMESARDESNKHLREVWMNSCRRVPEEPCAFVYDWKDDAEIQKYLRENKFKDRDEYPTFAKVYLIKSEREKWWSWSLDYIQSYYSHSLRNMIFLLVVGILIFAYGERLIKKFKSWITS